MKKLKIMLSLFKYLRLVSMQIDFPDSKLYFTANKVPLMRTNHVLNILKGKNIKLCADIDQIMLNCGEN